MIQVRAIEALPRFTSDLAPGDVHVWCVDLSGLQVSEQRLSEALSSEEHHRMARLHLGRDRYWFCLRRGLLRLLIGSYLGVPPHDIAFTYGAHGKPQVATAFGTVSLKFNMTHSDGFCLYAFSRDREVGVDIERIDRGFPYHRIVSRFFTSRERAEIIGLPATLRRAAFFHMWTLKEACVKADGRGLYLPLEQVVIPIGPRRPAVIKLPTDADGTVRQWSLHQLSLEPEFAAGLAVEALGVAV